MSGSSGIGYQLEAKARRYATTIFPAPIYGMAIGHSSTSAGEIAQAGIVGRSAEGKHHVSSAASSSIEPESVNDRGSRRPIGPFADPDEENRRPFFRVIRRHNRRARQIGSPAFRRVARNKKHQMRMPAHVVVA